jgi:hypothetical protein
MSVSPISSSSAPLPFNYLDTNTKAAPAASPNGSSETSTTTDASTAQPPAPPPLPPGQGTRVNQLV